MNQDFVERREDKRYTVLSKLVVLSPLKDLCLPLNISRGGLAIKCSGDNYHIIPSPWSVDILLKRGNFHAYIPMRLVWEKNVYHSYYPNVLGLQFEQLSETNRSKVEHLIKLHKDNI